MTSRDFAERIEAQYQNQLPFIVYRKPNDFKVKGLLQNTSQLFFTEHFTENGFVFSPFDNLEKTVIIPTNESEVINCSNWE